MNFCGKCGKELKEGAFCGGCGAKVETVANQSSHTGANFNPNSAGTTVSGLTQFTANIALFIATAFLFILNIILTFVPVIYEEVTQPWFGHRYESHSLSSLLNEGGLGILINAGIFLTIVTVIVLCLPLLTNFKYTTKSFILAKIWSIYSFITGAIFILITVIWANQDIERRGLGELASAGLTFGGYMFFLVNILLIIAIFKLSSKFKKKKK